VIKTLPILPIVLVLVVITFTTVQFAEGAVSWNSFLKEIGFNPPSVYEVSDSLTILAGDSTGGTITLDCLAGDKVDSGEVNFVTVPAIFVPGVVRLNDGDAVFIHDPASISSQGNPNLAKRIGYSVNPTLAGSGTPLDFDVEVFVTIHCLSPSSFQTVGGTWQPMDTTAVLIGYTVLNSYWMAPIAIGLGVGIYLIKSRWN